MKKFELFIKRLFDIVVSFGMLLVLTVIPVLPVLLILVPLTSKGPAIFTQERSGKDGKVFKIFKFRSMAQLPEGCYSEGGVLHNPDGSLVGPSSDRITPLGRILRKTSLDELPQLVNVLLGTMSFVGPRPTLPYQAERYTPEQHRRFQMRPGITGWAQVNGRNDLTWTEKIQFDLEYVDNFSLGMDLKILWRTVAVVFKKESIDFHKEDELTKK